MPELRDVSTDQQNQGLAANLVIDRDTASRLGITAAAIDNVLYDAFGQREVSTMYTALNQYYVVMEVDPKYQLSPDALNGIYIKASNVAGATAMPERSQLACRSPPRLPSALPLPSANAAPWFRSPPSPTLSAAHLSAVNHQGQYPAVTLTFNLAPNVALGDAVTALEKAQSEMGMPSAIHATFQGTAQAFQDSLKNEP